MEFATKTVNFDDGKEVTVQFRYLVIYCLGSVLGYGWVGAI